MSRPQYTASTVGLDVFVGTLTRYFSRDWKTIVEQAADFAFTGPHLTGQQVTFGSAPRLLDALAELNKRTFKATPQDLDRWRFEGPTSEKPNPFERTARFALAVFIQLTEKAVSERLPMILDY